MTAKHGLDLVSMYQGQRVLGANRIHLHLRPIAAGSLAGTLQLDPNVCQLDVWGDAQGCTKMAVHSLDVHATMMRTLDPQGHGRILYTLSIDGDAKTTCHLIHHAKASLWYLVEDVTEHERSVVPLFPSVGFSP